MESNSEQHFDKLAKKVFKSTNLEQPSLDFTFNVMAKLEGEKATTYRPLISKWGWLGIITTLVSISIYVFYSSSGESSILPNVDYSILSDNGVTQFLSNVSFSNTLMYAVMFLGVAWFIQVKMINQFIEKRLEY